MQRFHVTFVFPTNAELSFLLRRFHVIFSSNFLDGRTTALKLLILQSNFVQLLICFVKLCWDIYNWQNFHRIFLQHFFFLVKLLYNSDTKFCYFSFFVVVGGLLKLFILYNLMYQSLLSRNFQCNICSSPLTLLIASVFLRIFLGFVLKVAWEISNLSVETEINGRCSSFIFEIILTDLSGLTQLKTEKRSWPK